MPSVHLSQRDHQDAALVCRGAILVFFVSLVLCTSPARAGDTGAVRFSRDVLPILSENCLLCHGPDAKARKAELRLDLKESALRTKEPVIVPGKSLESELIRRIESDDAEEVMPPPKSGHKLTATQKQTLRRWIDEGANWGKHWAFETPVRPELPAVKDTRLAAQSDRSLRAWRGSRKRA